VRWPILKLRFDVVIISVEQDMGWKELLEAASESINDHIRLRNGYLMAENRILRNQINGRVQLTYSERTELTEIGVKLGKKALAEIATVAQPETILTWNRKFTDQPVDTSERTKSVGRPRVDRETEAWVLRMARENRSWGYDRIQGSLKHLGYTISDQTVGNILKRHGLSLAPERKQTVTWREFIRSHWEVLVATGFFNSEMWSWMELTMSHLLSSIHFTRHLAQSVVILLYRHLLAVQALMRQSFNLILDRRSWVSLVALSSQAGQDGKAFPEQKGSEFSLAEVQPLRSQDMAQVVVVSSAHRRPIRDEPNRCRHRFDGLQEENYREAA
jgi:transposase